MKDVLGNVLKVGDILVYGCDRGSVETALIAGFKPSTEQGGNKKITKIKVWRIERRAVALRSINDFNGDWEAYGQPENFRYEVIVHDRHHYLNGMGNYVIVCPDAIGYDDILQEVQRTKELRLKVGEIWTHTTD